MPYFLRAIYSNIKWDRTRFPSWLKEGELPSCLIRDLRADDNALSLWEIQEDESNLPDVVAALVAAERKSVKNDFDYALIDEKHLDEIVLKPTKKIGKTPYGIINSYHYDIPRLSINSVVYFAHLLSRYATFSRMGWKDIQARLRQANEKGQLDLTNIEDKLKEQLGISEQ
jgi:hypothetical protein